MSSRWPRPLIEAGVAIVRDAAGRVLLAQRQAFQLSPGFWELPGGKVEDGETPAEAAARELREEVGLEAVALFPFAVHEHVFPTRRVRLHLFSVPAWRGTPSGREGQPIAWVDPRAPEVGPILPSNLRAMAVLGLPRVIVGTRAGPRRTEEAVAMAPGLVARGAAALLVDEPGLAPAPRRMFALRLAAAVRPARGIVLVRGDAPAAIQAAAAGVADVPGRLPPPPSARAPFLRLAVCASPADVAAAAAADALLIDAPAERAAPWLASAPPCPAFVRGGAPAGLAGAGGRPLGAWLDLAALAREEEAARAGRRGGTVGAAAG